jgi:hypothetical protein
MPQIAGLGASVAAVDFNRDGWTDLYFTSSGDKTNNALYRNNQDGTFTDVAAEAGLADVNRDGVGASMGSIWADVDNDGYDDCFIYKYGYQQLFRNGGAATGGAATGGDATAIPKFTDMTERAGLRRWMNSNGATWIDYNRDGLLDLFVTGYFPESLDLWHLKDTKIMQESVEFAKNGGTNFLFKNLGDWKFEDVTAKTGVGETLWTLAAATADFDGDGWPDLFVANDYGTESLLLNKKGERFELAEGAGLNLTSKSGMCVALGDCGNRGRIDVFVTNIFKEGFSPQGNNLRVNQLDSSGRFANMAEGEVANCGWAWGAQFGDFNHDGFADLFVVNGFISADPAKDYWYDMSRVETGVSGVVSDAANWTPMNGRSLSGYERSRVLLNGGSGGFTDVAPRVGVNDLLDGRGVALADLFHRGCLDVIVANQRDRVLLYHNYPAPGRQWIRFELRGTRSNRSAVGAQVLLEWTDGAEPRKQLQSIDGGSGFASQNERILHFGLGSEPKNLRATIRWPAGGTETISDPAPNTLHSIREKQ